MLVRLPDKYTLLNIKNISMSTRQLFMYFTNIQIYASLIVVFIKFSLFEKMDVAECVWQIDLWYRRWNIVKWWEAQIHPSFICL